MTEEERMKIINEHYEHDKVMITREELKFGNMNYYIKKEEYIKKHLWKNASQVHSDIIKVIKEKIRGF